MKTFKPISFKGCGKPTSIISKELNLSKSLAKKLIDAGLVCLNGKKLLTSSKEVCGNFRIGFNKLVFSKPKAEDIKILYEDRELVIINKPPFLSTNEPKDGVERILQKSYPWIRAVHRLDKHTSGCLILAKSEDVMDEFKILFKNKKINKVYETVKIGKPFLKRITEPIDGKRAETLIISSQKIWSDVFFLKVKITTGRKHQIRRHLFPIVGEYIYTKSCFYKKTSYSPRILLHAKEVSFDFRGKTIRVIANHYPDFEEFLQFLKRA